MEGVPLRVNPAFQFVKEVRETRSVEEMVALLATGDWICMHAVEDERTGGYLFSLGRIF